MYCTDGYPANTRWNLDRLDPDTSWYLDQSRFCTRHPTVRPSARSSLTSGTGSRAALLTRKAKHSKLLTLMLSLLVCSGLAGRGGNHRKGGGGGGNQNDFSSFFFFFFGTFLKRLIGQCMIGKIRL